MNTKLNIIAIIPARMGSSRFPGKPLAKILDIPMLGHVYFRSKMSQLLNEVYVATCDHEIAEYIEGIGGKAIITSPSHERASDRAAEALEKVEKATGNRVDIIVMVQGDEPMLWPQMIDEALHPILTDESILVVNLMASMETTAEHDDVNEVKAVVDRQNFALYFSREAIPSRWKQGDDTPKFKQVCIIPFRRDFLLKYTDLEPTPLEVAESVDMLRVLEHGYKVKMVPTRYKVRSVDTEQDLKEVERLMKNDELLHLYSKG